jgi:hypothetical protein
MRKLEITSNCICIKYDDDGDPILNEDGDTIFAEWCSGCWEYQVDDLDYLLSEWLSENNLDPAFEDMNLYIGGSGIGWQRRSGFTVAQSNAKSVIDRLTFDGEWTLRFTLEDKKLSVVRSSHDEPTGTGELVFRLATDDEVWEFDHR